MGYNNLKKDQVIQKLKEVEAINKKLAKKKNSKTNLEIKKK